MRLWFGGRMPDLWFVMVESGAFTLLILCACLVQLYQGQRKRRKKSKEEEETPLAFDTEYWQIYNQAIVDLEEAWKEKQQP